MAGNDRDIFDLLDSDKPIEFNSREGLEVVSSRNDGIPKGTPINKKNIIQTSGKNYSTKYTEFASAYIWSNENPNNVGFDNLTNTWVSYDEFGAGKYAIGPGLTEINGKPIVKGQIVSDADIRKALNFKVKSTTDWLFQNFPAFTKLNWNEKTSIVDLVYNVGAGGFQWKDNPSDPTTKIETNAYQALKTGDMDVFKIEAFGPDGFNKFQGTFIQGLQNRRDSNLNFFEQKGSLNIPIKVYNQKGTKQIKGAGDLDLNNLITEEMIPEDTNERESWDTYFKEIAKGGEIPI
tara:strand:- start:3408 stop:4280 length:873 start_codon:yes stop_codon:yes gene_type:complete